MTLRIVATQTSVLRPLMLIWTPTTVTDFDSVTIIASAPKLGTGLNYVGPLVATLEYYGREPNGWVTVPCSTWLSVDEVTGENATWQLIVALPKTAKSLSGHTITIKTASPPGHTVSADYQVRTNNWAVWYGLKGNYSVEP